MWCAKMRNFAGPRFMKDAERKKSFQQPFKKVSFWKNDKNCHSLIIIVVIFNFSLSFLEISMEKSQTCPPHPQRRLVHSISGVWKG